MLKWRGVLIVIMVSENFKTNIIYMIFPYMAWSTLSYLYRLSGFCGSRSNNFAIFSRYFEAVSTIGYKIFLSCALGWYPNHMEKIINRLPKEKLLNCQKNVWKISKKHNINEKKTLLSVKYTGWISCILAKKLFYLKKKHKIENLEIENIKLM